MEKLLSKDYNLMSKSSIILRENYLKEATSNLVLKKTDCGLMSKKSIDSREKYIKEATSSLIKKLKI